GFNAHEDDMTVIDLGRTNLSAARAWHLFGFALIPIWRGTKRPAVKWDPWLRKLSPQQIQLHWESRPRDELGFIVGDQYLVLDADSPESVAALHRLEKEHEVEPLLVVLTSRGVHHYFQRASGT